MKYAFSIAALVLTTLMVGCGGPPDETATTIERPIYLVPPEGTSNTMSAMKDGWSVSGYLATGGVVLPANNAHSTTLPEISTQAKFTAEEERGGPGAQYFTVQFSVAPPPSGLFFAFAEVTWSTKGNAVRRLISIVNGAVISGTAQYVKVRMFDGTPADTLTSTGLTPEPYYVDALITPGTRPSTQQPPRLVGPEVEGTGSIPGVYQVTNVAGSIRVPIDQSAGIISLNSFAIVQNGAALDPITAGDVTLVFLQGSTNTSMGAVDLFAIQGEWLPIPPGADIVKIINGAGHDVLVNVDFGVEG